jgi:hypothetical protein
MVLSICLYSSGQIHFFGWYSQTDKSVKGMDHHAVPTIKMVGHQPLKWWAIKIVSMQEAPPGSGRFKPWE